MRVKETLEVNFAPFFEVNLQQIMNLLFSPSGPLVTKRGNNVVLYGIISWGSGTTCADPKFPGVYAKVSVYKKWIDNIKSNSQG